MHILVTGAAGYIGSICAEILLKRGHTVLSLDNLSEGHRPAVPEQSIFFECDLANREELNRIFRSHSIDAVMHFAGESIIEKSVREPSATYLANVVNGIHLLNAMEGNGVHRIIFSSTASVYGSPETVPITEEHRTVPINPYGWSKLHFEFILEGYRASTGLRYLSLRYFNAAGASAERGKDHRRETHLIPILLDVALGRRKQLEINDDDYATSDGTCIRDYVHVLDIAKAHLLALDQLDRFSWRVFNVGNSRGYSVLEVLRAARRVTGKSIPRGDRTSSPWRPANLGGELGKNPAGIGLATASIRLGLHP